MWRRRLILGLCLALVGCTTGPGPSPDAEVTTPPFLLPPGQAALYVVRQVSGGPAQVPILVDRHPVGALAVRTYLVLAVDPGTHTITAATPAPQASLTLTTHAGRHYFIGLLPQGNTHSARVELAAMDEAAGTIAVLETTRVPRGGEP